MNANPKFLNATAHVDEAAVKALPNSRKVYVEGSRPDIRVPMREISQSDTPAGMGAEKNPPIYVYDTSGPYTDPAVKIDIRSGLAPLREKWIVERNDTGQASSNLLKVGKRKRCPTGGMRGRDQGERSTDSDEAIDGQLPSLAHRHAYGCGVLDLSERLV